MKTSLTTLTNISYSKNGSLNKNLANLAFLFCSTIPSKCNSCVFLCKKLAIKKKDRAQTSLKLSSVLA